METTMRKKPRTNRLPLRMAKREPTAEPSMFETPMGRAYW